MSPRGGTRRTARPGPDQNRRPAFAGSLTREIRTPSEWIGPTFETVTIVTKQAQRIRGVKKAEDVFTIQIMDTGERIQGCLRSEVIREDLVDARISSPGGDSDMTDLVGYLGSLRGGTVPARQPSRRLR